MFIYRQPALWREPQATWTHDYWMSVISIGATDAHDTKPVPQFRKSDAIWLNVAFVKMYNNMSVDCKLYNWFVLLMTYKLLVSGQMLQETDSTLMEVYSSILNFCDFFTKSEWVRYPVT